MRISPFVDGTAYPLSGMLTNKSAVARPPAPPSLALCFFLSFQRQHPRAENTDSEHAQDDEDSFEVQGLSTWLLASPSLTHTHNCSAACATRRGTYIAAGTRQLPGLIGRCPRGDSRSIMESESHFSFPNGNQATTSICKTMSSLPPTFACRSCIQLPKKQKPRQAETGRNLSPEKSRAATTFVSNPGLDRSTTPATTPKQANSHSSHSEWCLRFAPSAHHVHSQSMNETGRCERDTRTSNRYPSVYGSDAGGERKTRDGRTGQAHRTRAAARHSDPPGAQTRV
jgi:hypothetical protein